MKRFAAPMIMLVLLLAGCASAPNQAGSKDPARFEGEPISINAPASIQSPETISPVSAR